ncbi:hypothetical protein LRC484719_22570 [Mycobacterium riyadhense]|uniref:Uncharacterized protein n=1 Tax=Mycobacterium riyadhense TaxID=486698 RepID=A0A653EK80_9MYCO|nr:hypothetical protein BIN_B_02319 [Mycobacterium riyadhense]
MRLGLHALGIGSGAQRSGYTLWAGEHVVMVDRPASRYHYSDDGVIAVPAQADWLDPTIAQGLRRRIISDRRRHRCAAAARAQPGEFDALEVDFGVGRAMDSVIVLCQRRFIGGLGPIGGPGE